MKSKERRAVVNKEVSNFTFRTPKPLLKIIKDYSSKKGVSANATILQILWEWLRTKKD